MDWSLLQHHIEPLTMCAALMGLDILFYGTLIPILGSYVASTVAFYLNMSPPGEMLLVVLTVFCTIYVAFFLNIEGAYWTRLFLMEKPYDYILILRDFVNSVFLAWSILHVVEKVDLIGLHGLKEHHVGEGIPYLVFSGFQSLGVPIESSLVNSYLPKYRGQAAYISSAEFVLSMASLSANVSKLLYFNTLFTYERAMQIFMGFDAKFSVNDTDSVIQEDEPKYDACPVTCEHAMDQVVKRTKDVRTYYAN